MYKTSRTISFLEVFEDRPVSEDLKKIDILRGVAREDKGLKKLGFGNFLIKVFREWEVNSAAAAYASGLEERIKELKKEIEELKANK